MSVAEGTMFGNYRIARPIGTGGFSTVYLANDDRLDAEVAVKVLAENRALDVDARRRFIEEAQKLRKVQSNAVVTVYDVGQTSGKQPYMVLEYADRGDLANRQQALGRPVPADGCVQVIEFLHQALSALHGVGLVHRDVKPHNILIRTSHGAPRAHTSLLAGNERLLLGDLGFVKDLTMASGLTVGGGTWAYQAPEQRQRMGSVDARADIFSASAVIAWLLVGQQPTEGEDWHGLLHHAAIAPAVKEQLLVGMAESPNDRHPTIELWHVGLNRALQPPTPIPTIDSPGGEPTVVQPRSNTTEVMVGQLGGPNGPIETAAGQHLGAAQRPARRSLWPAVLAAMALLGAGGFAAGWIVGSDNEPTQVVAEDGTTNTIAEIEGRTITISGPTEVPVGTSTTFVATVPADVTGSWVYPDGSLADIGEGVTFTANSSGVFSVALVVVVPGAEPELIIHEVKAAE